MAFWGIEIKPGKPYIHHYDESKGRLHISQATLGNGSSGKKSTVQCNIGKKSPILLCSLLPEKMECCPLDLEFEEEDEVVFSILGPRSVHLTGFYIGSNFGGQHDGDESDSFGEDIMETETDESSDYDTDEDKYEDDFIDDGGLEVFPHSPRPNSSVVIEEILDDEETINEKRNTRPSKKDQKIDSSSDVHSQQQIVVKGSSSPILERVEEDDLPISLPESEGSAKGMEIRKLESGFVEVINANVEKGQEGTGLKRKIDARDQEDDLGKGKIKQSEVSDVAKMKKKKKGAHDDKIETQSDSKQSDDRTKSDLLVLSSNKNGKRKKKKKNAKDKVQKDAEPVNSENITPEDNNFEQTNINVEMIGQLNKDVIHEKKKKKKKKKGEILTDQGKKDNSEQIDLTTSEKLPTKTRTFPNGLVIEELSMGKPDGKRASPGNRVSVNYIGKLKNGEIFDSNIGTGPFKFRLGIGQVIKGWDVGVNGMRIGDKRRLTIPPSMGYGSQGAGKIPGNAWLVFDVELVDAR